MPTSFDGLIDIQHVPDSFLITKAQTSGKGPNKCKSQQPMLQLSTRENHLCLVITICGKPSSAKFINTEIFWDARQIDYQIKGRLRIMDLRIITAALFLCSYISTQSLLYSRLIFNWVWMQLATRWLFMAWLHSFGPGAVGTHIDITLSGGIRGFQSSNSSS